MTDKIFQEMAEQMRPDAELRDSVLARIEAEGAPAADPTAPAATPRRPWARWLAPAVAAVTVAALIGVGVSGGWSINSGGTTSTAGDGVADYGTLYAAVRDAPASSQLVLGSGLEDRTSPKPQAASGSWATNVQVRAIDEGDLVKSDGHSIFVASGKQVSIVAAAGDGTRVLARIDTSTGEAGKSTGDRSTIQGPVVDLMLRGTTLVVLVTEYQARSSELPTSMPMPSQTVTLPLDASLTKALIYDVSDPAVPRYQGSLGQSGGLVTTRLADNVLYLVTEYLIADQKAATKDDPATFVPVLTQDQAVKVSRPDDCVIMPAPSGPTYTVVSSIDLEKRTRIDSESVFGGTSTVYMSEANLYLGMVDASPSKAVAEKAGAPKGLKQVTVTNLARISVDAGQLSLAAQGSVPGTLLSQFALDEHDNTLRVVTTLEGEDAKHRWVQRAGLYLLNADLNRVGAIPSLAKDESVRSVRFDGAVGYVVTFRSVDPLFAIDLAQPTAPRVLSALKIPGFSSYLHPWADGRLLGFGRDVTGGGEDRGMKLSMFDTSNPLAVTEMTTLRVKGDDSEALNDHRAVLVDASAGLIGFPVTSWDDNKAFYEVYRYDQASGFAKVGRVKVQASLDRGVASVRGLTIDGTLYVTSPQSVFVYRLAGFAEVAKVALDK
jgi:inhibitor of cysteine peptidase